jgi:glycosyltransferase involved in cell wall biosynthesis
MLLNAPYPADIRVKKEADALLQAGFEVHLLCLRKKSEAYEQVFEGIKITRIDAGKNNYVLAFWDVMMSINFIHARFQAAANTLLQKEKITVVHVHDLPLAGTALSLRKRLGLNVVVDLHENYPEALKTWFKWKKNPIVRLKNYLFLNPSRWSEFERRACEESDAVIAVVEEMKERLIQEYRIRPEKITVVTNTEDKSFLTQPLTPDVYKTLEGKFIITYSGGIGPHRGVDTAIRGMQYLKDIPQIQLAVVGFGSSSVMNGLKALVADLRLSSVHFFGRQPFSKFYSYMHFADVNVIPHQSNGHTDNTVPHKLFQGMMAGRPMLVSSSAPLKRYVTRYNSGLIFDAGNPEDYAEKARQLYRDATLRETLGKNGIAATVGGTLNWETTQKELIHLYDSFYVS